MNPNNNLEKIGVLADNLKKVAKENSDLLNEIILDLKKLGHLCVSCNGNGTTKDDLGNWLCDSHYYDYSKD